MSHNKSNSLSASVLIGIAVALSVITAAVYFQITSHAFVNYDDQVYISENPHIRDGFTMEAFRWLWTTYRGGNWHPLVWLSILLDVELYGIDQPGGHHLSNLILHVLNTLLLFTALTMMTRRPWASSMVAALFALHPLHVESVAWAAERKDTLSGLFWMLTLIAYACYARQPTARRYAWVTAAFLGGLLSKSVVVTLPCVLLLLDVWPLRRLSLPGKDWSWRRNKRVLLEKIPWLVLSGILALVTIIAQQSVGAVAGREAIALDVRLKNAAVAYVGYLVKMIWPARLQVFYPHPLDTIPWWQVVGALAILGALTWLAWRWRQRFPYIGVGWLWYLGVLVPMIGILQVGEQAMADRYSYLPLTGLFIALVWGIERLLRDHHWTLSAIPAAAILMAVSVRTWQQAGHWRDTEHLFRHALTVNPDNHLAHGNLAAELARQGDYDGAVRHFQEVLRIRPNNPGALSGLGAACYKMGQEAKAIALYEQVLERRPDHTETHVNYGTALLNQYDWAGALAHYEQALPEASENPVVHYGLAESLKELDRAGEAMVHARRALELDPDYAEAYNTLGILHRRRGDLEQAQLAYETALRLNPEQGEVHHNLALLAEQRGDTALAREHYEAALAHDYQSERLHFNLGNVLQRQQQLTAAIAQYRQALAIRDTYQPAWVNLGVALTSAGQLDDAITCFQRALTLNPQDPGAHNSYGAALYYQGDFATASRHFAEALRLDPDYPGAADNLQRARRKLAQTH